MTASVGASSRSNAQVDPVLGDIASWGRIVDRGIKRHDHLVIDGGVIERKRADKIPVAGDAVGGSRVATRHRYRGGSEPTGERSRTPG